MTNASARRDRQVIRVLGLLKTLSEGGHPTVHQLAARFKTRRETIYRDIHTLEAIDYPVVGDESGRLSHPRLAPGVRPTVAAALLTRREMAALVWAVKHTGPGQPFRSALATAMAKLQAMAVARDGHLAVGLDGAVGGWDRGVKDYGASEPVILRIIEAIVSRRRCDVDYRSPGQDRPRRFPCDAYRLLSVHGGLYCVGKVPAYRNIATLAVDRIAALELTDETFSVDPAFDPERLETEAFGVSWENPMTVVIRFRADQAPTCASANGIRPRRCES